jgi:hypothetical protein
LPNGAFAFFQYGNHIASPEFIPKPPFEYNAIRVLEPKAPKNTPKFIVTPASVSLTVKMGDPAVSFPVSMKNTGTLYGWCEANWDKCIVWLDALIKATGDQPKLEGMAGRAGPINPGQVRTKDMPDHDFYIKVDPSKFFSTGVHTTTTYLHNLGTREAPIQIPVCDRAGSGYATAEPRTSLRRSHIASSACPC